MYVFTDWIIQKLCIISPSKLCFIHPSFQLTLPQRNSLLNNRYLLRAPSGFPLQFHSFPILFSVLHIFLLLCKKFSFSLLPKILVIQVRYMFQFNTLTLVIKDQSCESKLTQLENSLTFIISALRTVFNNQGKDIPKILYNQAQLSSLTIFMRG